MEFRKVGLAAFLALITFIIILITLVYSILTSNIEGNIFYVGFVFLILINIAFAVAFYNIYVEISVIQKEIEVLKKDNSN